MISEGRLEIQVPANCVARKFDDGTHGLSHCMKAVDFIIDTPNSLIFLEIKDPEAAEDQQRKAEYIEKLSSGNIDNNLKYKFRDTLMYLYASDKLHKPVSYFVLLGISNISSESLSRRTESLQHQLPMKKLDQPWVKPIATSCAVFNVETWNVALPQFMVTVRP